MALSGASGKGIQSATMTRITRVLRVFLFVLPLSAAGLHDEIPFLKRTIHPGAAESCAAADLNGDGRLDVIAGENWLEGPAWTPHRFRELHYERNYIDDFSALVLDVNEDGRPDVISATWFSKELAWYENPGRGGSLWRKHVIDSGSPSEFAFLVDLDNDGRARELLPQFGSNKTPLAWYRIENGRWVKRVVSPESYGHGIGAGDVNGDGRTDILTPRGWWEAPPDPLGGGWIHREEFTALKLPHLGFLFVLDLDGRSSPDVLTSFAHDYGLLWLERREDGQWTKNVIDDSWSQAHAVTLADLNGDGQTDIVTGKRFHAHNGKDPGGREPLGVFWYEYRRQPDGTLLWKRHILDYGSRTGAGMQIPVVDLDGDGDLDILAPGKGGLFLFENQTRR